MEDCSQYPEGSGSYLSCEYQNEQANFAIGQAMLATTFTLFIALVAATIIVRLVDKP